MITLKKFLLFLSVHILKNESLWIGLFKLPLLFQYIVFSKNLRWFFLKKLIYRIHISVSSFKWQNTFLLKIYKGNNTDNIRRWFVDDISLSFSEKLLWVWQRKKSLDLVLQELHGARTWFSIMLLLLQATSHFSRSWDLIYILNVYIKTFFLWPPSYPLNF